MKRIKDRLRSKYRLIIFNDDTLNESLSLKLSGTNVFITAGVSLLLFTIFIMLFIAFTPVREFIPGYTNVSLRKIGVENSIKVDSLEQMIEQDIKYIDVLKNIMKGELVGLDEDLVIDSTLNYEEIIDRKNKEDSVLRSIVESTEKYNLFDTKKLSNKINDFTFFNPAKGVVINSFDPSEEHYGIDIIAQKEEPIKAILDGMVIFSEWTIETGYVIQIQHEGNLISIYKHNELLYKKSGEFVKAGDVIAMLGNSGEFSSGYHLHFEMWYNGLPVNPVNYFIF